MSMGFPFPKKKDPAKDNQKPKSRTTSANEYSQNS